MGKRFTSRSRGIGFRVQSWRGDDPNAPTRPVAAPPEPLVTYSGRHPDGTAHRLSGCTCGRDGEDPFPVVQASLHEQGYRPEAPSTKAQRRGAQACREWPCETCGHIGLTYQPFWQPTERSYRAFAVCPQCGRVEEF